MSRTLFRSLRHPLVVLPVLVMTSSARSSAEQQLLTNFFRASRVRDNATLSNIATVQLNPRTDGIVQDFTVTTIGPEEKRTLQLQQTLDEVAQAQQAETEFAKRKKEYQDANLPALQRVSSSQREKKPITGKDAEVLAAWNKISAEELITKQVTVDAQVKSPDGQTTPKTLVFTFQRAIGKKDGQTNEGRWIITNLQQGSAPKT